MGHRRGFIKLHVGVDTRTKKIYAVVITDDKCGDSPQFEELVGRLLQMRKNRQTRVRPQTPESQLTVRTIPRISAATATSAEPTR